MKIIAHCIALSMLFFVAVDCFAAADSNSSDQVIIRPEAKLNETGNANLHAENKNDATNKAEQQRLMEIAKARIEEENAMRESERARATLAEMIRVRRMQKPASSSPEEKQNVVSSQYLLTVGKHMQKYWILPDNQQWNTGVEAVVVLTILRDGTVAKTVVDQKSNAPSFDQLVMDAIQKASPMPSFPVSMPEDSIEIGLRFRPGEFQDSGGTLMRKNIKNQSDDGNSSSTIREDTLDEKKYSGFIASVEPCELGEGDKRLCYIMTIQTETGVLAQGDFYEGVDIYMNNKKEWPEEKINEYNSAECRYNFSRLVSRELETGRSVDIIINSRIGEEKVITSINVNSRNLSNWMMGL